jgi:hypothetical protein
LYAANKQAGQRIYYRCSPLHFHEAGSMSRLIRFTTCCAMILFLATSLIAADEAKPKKGKKAKAAPVSAAFKLPNGITLTADQQAKLDELKTQYATKLADAEKKISDVYTEEQRTQQTAARRDAMAAGKKGKELKAAVDAAVKLTDEQQKKLADAQKDQKQLTKEVRKQVVAMLSDEQKQQLKGKKS